MLFYNMLLPADGPTIAGMTRATKMYKEATHGKAGHAHGSPDQWCWSALL